MRTGALTGWTQEDLGFDAEWVVYSGTMTHNGFEVLPPPVGTYAAVVYQTNEDSNALYQDIAVPPGA